jgi:hypothetical protein
MKKIMLAIAVVALSAVSAAAADNPWTGKWKLDLTKSDFAGDTFTYSQAANGMYHFSDGSTVSFDFGIDGKEYPTVYGYSGIWTAGGDKAWDSVSKFKGKVTDKSHAEISPDGKTLTFKDTGTKPDGSTFSNTSVYTRLSGTTGLTGKWKSTKINISAPDELIVTSPSEGVLRWEDPQYKSSMQGKLDGSDIAVTGPTVPAKVTQAFKIDSPSKLSYTVKVDGKIVGLGTQTISPDGKTFSDVSWNPGKESEKSKSVYNKQ